MLPTTHTAGDTFAAPVSLAAYPASAGWAAKLRLVPRAAGGTVVELTAAAAGDGFQFTALPAVTTDWVAGAYSSVLWVERGADKYTVAQGQLQIAPDPRTLAAGADTRSLPRKTLDDLLAARAVWASTQGRTRRYKIGDREREFNTAAELDAEIRFWQGQLANELAAERLAAGLRPRNRILTRFVRPR